MNNCCIFQAVVYYIYKYHRMQERIECIEYIYIYLSLYMCLSFQKWGGQKYYIYFYIKFFKEVSSVHRAWIYLIQHTANAVILWKYFTKNNCFLFEHSLNFNSASLLQSSVSHDPSEIVLICCSRHFFNYHYFQYLKLFSGLFDE